MFINRPEITLEIVNMFKFLLYFIIFIFASALYAEIKSPIAFHFVTLEPHSDYIKVENNEGVYFAHPKAVFSTRDIALARVDMDEYNGMPTLFIRFKNREKFYRITRDNVGKMLGFFIYQELVMAPVIREGIKDGQVRVSGGFTSKEVLEQIVEDIKPYLKK